jgi:DNA polymerase-3 subunit epsilon
VYAVVDVETTGLNPGWKHRVAEIAIVLLDQHGLVELEWCSLVNPQRDLGAQDVHGIRAADVRRAPVFDDLAGHVAELLAGRVLVAHNLPFDAMFLHHEYALLGVDVPVRSDLGLCTMRLAPRYLRVTSRSLRDCCLAAGVRLEGWHSALVDARAATGLLTRYLSLASDPPPWAALLGAATDLRWPYLPSQAVVPVVRSTGRNGNEHFLSRLADQLPRVPHPPEADTYLAVLDQALIDRYISESEADELVSLAAEFGLDRAAVTDLHHAYLGALARTALSDGIVSQDERHDLESVAHLLGLGVNAVNAALTTAAPDAAGDLDLASIGSFLLRPGDVVVLTGEMTEPREVLETRGRAAGLQVGKGVTKKTRVLVAADPDSLSGKARKARDYGIPIVTEAAFGRLLAELRTQNERTAEPA